MWHTLCPCVLIEIITLVVNQSLPQILSTTDPSRPSESCLNSGSCGFLLEQTSRDPVVVSGSETRVCFLRFGSPGWFLAFILCVVGLLCHSVPQPSDWLERLVPEMTCYVSSAMVKTLHTYPTHRIAFTVSGLLNGFLLQFSQLSFKPPIRPVNSAS